MSPLIAMGFWVGVALTISELHYARRAGTPIPRSQKWSLFFGVLLVFVAIVVATELGVERESASFSGAICLAGVFNVWALKHRIRRKTRKAP